MNPGKIKKDIDYKKLNVGVELECQIVHADSLKQITKAESQIIFKSLAETFQWELAGLIQGEIPNVRKKLSGFITEIKIDLCYSILEISTLFPVPNLELLETIYKQALSEFTQVLKKLGMKIWEHGVAPASSGLNNLPFKTKEEYTNVFFGPIGRIESFGRFCHITSEQVCIDVPVEKVIPAMNALYKNLGTIIKKFANSPMVIGEKLYKEGRFYFWNDVPPILNNPKRYFNGVSPVFPPHQFKNFQDLYSWNWQSEFVFVMRNGEAHTFKDTTMSPARFLKERRGIVLTPSGEEREIEITSEDIELLFRFNWLDFKPHFDFDKKFTVDEFLNHWNNGKIDDFINKHCHHAYLEIRPCSPHYENNAMDMPRYFYEIFSNLDQYIKNSEKIGWEIARKKRDGALKD